MYIGGVYEKALKTGEVTKYYSLGGRRVAMRKGATLSYLANDHLGGTSLVMDANGNATSRMRYYPYGQAWTQSAAPATDKLFTGHTRLGARSGMYYAGARFYSADLGRFMSADSIVPGAGDPQALNRYAYVRGNPLRFSDPTGHRYEDGWTPNTRLPKVAGSPLYVMPSTGPVGYGVGSESDGAFESYMMESYCFGIGDCTGYGVAGEGTALIASGFAFGIPDQSLGLLAQFRTSFTSPSSKHQAPVNYVSGKATRVAPENLVKHFKGNIKKVVLDRDLAVRRVFGGEARARGNWWTTHKVSGSTSASRGLHLPDANLATNVVEGIIPKGTTVYTGRSYGGWAQIYIEHSGDVSFGVSRSVR